MAEQNSQQNKRIRVRCESCGKEYRLTPESVGKKAKCVCGHIFVVSTAPRENVSAPEVHKLVSPPPPVSLGANGSPTSTSWKDVAFGTFAFPPIKTISFPKVCVGCLSKEAQRNLRLNVKGAAVSSQFTIALNILTGAGAGGLVGTLIGYGLNAVEWPLQILGALIGAVFGAIHLGPLFGVPGRFSKWYRIPICDECFSKLHRKPISALLHILFGPILPVSNVYLKCEAQFGTVVLAFANLGYAEAFRRLNVGKGQIDTATFMVGPAGSLEEQLQLLLEKVLPHCPEKRWFVQPNIPFSKLNNAIDTYARGVSPDEVLALADCTLTGSAKKGCLLTAKIFYYNDSDDVAKWRGSVPWRQILKAVVFANGYIELYLRGERRIVAMCSLLSVEILIALRQLIDQVVLFNFRNS